MRANEMEAALRRHLKEAGQTLKGLTLGEAVPLMLAFFQNHPCSDAIGDDGDGLAFYSAIVQRTSGTPFEVGFMRMFRAASCGADVAGCRLRLTLNFPWWETLEKTKLIARLAGGPEQSKYCWVRSDIANFEASIKAHALYDALHATPPRSANIKFEPLWGIYG